jgi:hypothetical protein
VIAHAVGLYLAIGAAVGGYVSRGEPGLALDRLHTLLTKYVRERCQRHGIAAPRDEPLQSLFGEYVKHPRAVGRLGTEMVVRILRACVSALDAFNPVRNDRTLAHDNAVVWRAEATFLFNHVTSLVRFVDAIDPDHAGRGEHA